MQHEDTTFMLRIKDGDQLAFKQLVEKHQLSVINLCLRFTGKKTDAEDLAQDIFIRIYRAAPRYEAKAAFSTWMYRIAINLCLNYQRRKKLLEFFSIHSNHHEEDRHQKKTPELLSEVRPDIDFELRERQQFLQAAIQSLPENQRSVVILYRYDNLSYQEIAEVLETSVSAVESRLHRAKLNLKKKLAPLIKEELSV
jgi:RNA polymerase sigma-70 factor (ECF subfamily)